MPLLIDSELLRQRSSNSFCYAGRTCLGCLWTARLRHCCNARFKQIRLIMQITLLFKHQINIISCVLNSHISTHLHIMPFMPESLTVKGSKM